MKIEKINDNFSVSDQVFIEDIPALLSEGVELIVCNRPDNEATGQPYFTDIQTAAKEHGIEAHLIDFAPKALTQDKTLAFKKIVESNKKIHGYCFTGGRAKMIYNSMSLEE